MDEKQYSVSEEELNRLLAEEYLLEGRKRKKRLEDFLKSKKPVQKEQPKFATEKEIRGIITGSGACFNEEGGYIVAYKDMDKIIEELSKLSIDRDRVEKAIKKFADKINYPVMNRDGKCVGLSGSGYELDEEDLDKIVDAICKTGGEDGKEV